MNNKFWTFYWPIICGCVGGLILYFIIVSAANAQSICMARQEMVDRLVDSTGETEQTVMTANGPDGKTIWIFSIFANIETGSWSIVRTSVLGTSCLMTGITSGNGDYAHSEQPPAEMKKEGEEG